MTGGGWGSRFFSNYDVEALIFEATPVDEEALESVTRLKILAINDPEEPSTSDDHE